MCKNNTRYTETRTNVKSVIVINVIKYHQRRLAYVATIIKRIIDKKRTIQTSYLDKFVENKMDPIIQRAL